MQLVYKKPMFWWLITIFHPNAKWGNVAFAFGNTIYTATRLTESQIEHEKVHLKQHKYSILGGIWQLIRCTFSAKYYLKQEIEAYQAQNNVDYRPILYASYLSSPVYNSIITYEEALKLFQ